MELFDPALYDYSLEFGTCRLGFNHLQRPETVLICMIPYRPCLCMLTRQLVTET